MRDWLVGMLGMNAVGLSLVAVTWGWSCGVLACDFEEETGFSWPPTADDWHWIIGIAVAYELLCAVVFAPGWAALRRRDR